MDDAIVPCYSGEALLLRWGDSPKGRTVTLQLDEHVGEQHPFKGYKVGGNGQRMQVVCVLIDDHEEPQQPKADAPARSPKKFSEMPRSQQAGIMLGKPEFQEWLYAQADGTSEKFESYNEMLKTELGVSRKRELDTDPAKAEAWDKLMASFQHKDLQR